MRFTAKIEEGKITWHDANSLTRYLYEVEGEVYIDIKPSKVRNTAQNNYYWSILRDWGKDIGEDDTDYMHGLVKSHFKLITITEFNKDEFSEFLTELERYAAKHGWNGKPRSTKLP